MKLPQLQGAPVQRLTTPDPATAAAPMQALGDIGEMVGGKVDEYLEERRKERLAVDYTTRLSDIENASIDALSQISENPYTRVQDLPKGIEVPKGTIEVRYDPQSDTLTEFVPTDEVSDDLYTAFMSDFTQAQIENAKDEAVGLRLREKSMGVISSARKQLLKDHLTKSKARDTAKFKLTLDEAIQRGDELGVMQLIARAELTMGIDGAETLRTAQAAIDENYFIKSSQRAKTPEEIEALKTEVVEGSWRFDTEKGDELYGALLKRQSDLQKIDERETKERQDTVFMETIGQIYTEGMTVDQVKALQLEMSPTQYKTSLAAAQTYTQDFKTPAVTVAYFETAIQAIANGDYSFVNADNFEDAQANLRENLNAMFISFDPYDSQNFDQKMSGADVARFNEEINALSGVAVTTGDYKEAEDQIYRLITGGSKDAFSMNFNEDSELRVQLYRATRAFYEAGKRSGPDFDAWDWVDNNLYKYTKGPARDALIGLDSNLSSLVRWNTTDSKVSREATIKNISSQLDTATSKGDTKNIDDLRQALADFDRWSEEYSANVE